MTRPPNGLRAIQDAERQKRVDAVVRWMASAELPILHAHLAYHCTVWCGSPRDLARTLAWMQTHDLIEVTTEGGYSLELGRKVAVYRLTEKGREKARELQEQRARERAAREAQRSVRGT